MKLAFPIFDKLSALARPPVRTGVLLLVALVLAGCQDMAQQSRFDPLEENTFFADRRSARPLVAGTVPRGESFRETHFTTSRAANGELLDSYPFEITLQVLERGRERYEIYCAPCHGLDGYGAGMIVQRGFAQPASFHEDRLRQAPAGYYYEVITNGFGQMYSYAYRVAPADRWAIAAYVRALQLSQSATEQDVPPEALPQLEENQ